MSEIMLESTCKIVRWQHDTLLKVTGDLNAAQFYWRPGPQAPPIGWHLWHVARWTDRVRTAFPRAGGEPYRQIWDIEALALRYELDPAQLGLLQCGEGMDHEAAAQLPREIGQENILAYARRTFAAMDEAMGRLTTADAEWMRPNCRPYITENKRVISAPAKVTPLFGELTFLCSHGARHLGMIEALRGAQGMHGTASA